MIIKFSGVITIDKSNVYTEGQGQRSKFKFIEVKTNFTQILPFLDD